VPTLRITVIDHDRGGRQQHRTCRSPVRIGRDKSNDLVLAAAFVARWQAVLTFDAQGVSIVALGASNPLRHNGRALSPGVSVELAHADGLTLGGLEIRVSLRPDEGAAAQVTRAGPPSPDEGSALAGTLAVAPRADASPLERVQAIVPQLAQLHRQAAAAVQSWDDACAAELDRFAELTHDNPEERTAQALLREQIAALGPLVERWRAPPGPELLNARGLISELALELIPDLPPPREEATIRRFLRRTAGAVQTLAAMLLELQAIWSDERTRLGIKTSKSADGPLQLSPAQLIERLVDPESARPVTDTALLEAAVGMQDHVRALVRSAETAALELAHRLAPRAFDHGHARVFPWRSASAWRAYRETYRRLCGEDGRRAATTLRTLLREAYTRESAGAGEGGRR